MTAIDPKVQCDFDGLIGRSFKLCRAEAYIGDTDNQITVVFDPPVAFRLEGKGVLNHSNDEWIDPIYDVVPVDPQDPQVAKYRSFYCYGRSYNTKTGETQTSDLVSVSLHDGTWWAYP